MVGRETSDAWSFELKMSGRKSRNGIGKEENGKLIAYYPRYYHRFDTFLDRKL